MPDLRTLMNEAVADLSPQTSDPQLDLTRARRALRRQRSRQALIPAGLAAAAGVLAFSVLSGGAPDAPQQAAPTTTASSEAIDLIAYSGEQPEGFTIDQVPDGWTVQGIDQSSLVIAPEGFSNTNPSEFTGKIAVFMANENDLTVERHEEHPLEIDGVEARRFTWDTEEGPDGQPVPGPDAPAGLLKPDHGDWLLFQFAEGLNWDDATIADFAAGVHLTGDAQAGNG